MKPLHIILMGFALTCATGATCASAGQERVDALALFRDMTNGKSQLLERTGEPTQFSSSEKACVKAVCTQGDSGCTPSDHYDGSPLMAGSDYMKYYGLTTGADGYSHYSADSQYKNDVAALATDLDRLMESFQRSGLIREVKRRAKTPALMFDIDNTLEFSAAADEDPKGEGPAIESMVEFVKRWCFKDGLACYFVTARDCNADNVTSTEKWLKANLGLSEKRLRRYTHYSRNTQSLTCDVPGKTVAYKDVIREALERQDKVFWLMSIGDQLTDSLGEHSGMKIRVPNQFFHSDIVPNQDAPWGKGMCASPATIAPPHDCSERLLDKAVKYSSADYCSTQPAHKP